VGSHAARPDARRPLTLGFVDAELERAFQVQKAIEGLPGLRIGLAAAAILWAVAGALMPLITAVPPSRLRPVFLLMIAANAVGLVLSRWASTLDRQHAIGASANTLAGVAILFLALLTDLFERYAAPGLMLMTIFAFMVLRIRFVAALLAALICAVAFAVIAAGRPQGGSHAMDMFLLYSGVGVAAAAAYVLESGSRQLFYQRRMIAEQQLALEREKEKSDRLLLNVFPAPIAARLREEHSALAEGFEDATVLFADLVGFTALTERLAPAELVGILDTLFSRFDDLAGRHGVEKIKTIGDAYMVAGGVPERCADHAERVVAMGLEMLQTVELFARETGRPLALRVGVHSGPVVAGVIGKRKFIYDLWGDTVNTASRMESHGIEGAVHVSAETFRRVSHRFHAEDRGEISVKGKGLMTTHLLVPAAPPAP
jgi:class 3 adenylate cyclase